MVEQSQPPTILLTRPQAQSLRFARQLRAAARQSLHITISPLMQLEFRTPPLPQPAPAGLIFTSEAGIAAYLRISNHPIAPVFCVGQNTAKKARNAGLETVLVVPDASTLLSRLLSTRPCGPLLHLRGQDSTGDIAATLTAGGIPTDEAIIYAQTALPLAPRARRLLHSHQPLILPLFSARSARLLAKAAPHPRPNLSIAAISRAVAAEIPPDWRPRLALSPTPDARGMLETVLALLAEPASA